MEENRKFYRLNCNVTSFPQCILNALFYCCVYRKSNAAFAPQATASQPADRICGDSCKNVIYLNNSRTDTMMFLSFNIHKNYYD